MMIQHWLLITHHSSLITHHSSLITHHSLLITHHSLLITHYSLLITHHSSLITHHSSLITRKTLRADTTRPAAPPDDRLASSIPTDARRQQSASDIPDYPSLTLWLRKPRRSSTSPPKPVRTVPAPASCKLPRRHHRHRSHSTK